ncbi:MAG: HPP family protein [Anaerolineae bacterium]
MIGTSMKRQVIAVTPATTVREAAQLVVAYHVGTLPVVDEQGALVGVVRLEDLLQVFMPDFVALLEDIDFIHDFGVLERLHPADVPAAAQLTMRDLMQPPCAVEQTCGLLRAYAVMLKHDIRDLPVVNKAGSLVGIASRVDIAAAFLASWTNAGPTS